MKHLVGSVVMLRSGGPLMLVQQSNEKLTTVVWIEDGAVKAGDFPGETLELKLAGTA